MPEAAKAHTAAGAEAFVKFYWAMVNYAQESGVTTGLKQLGTESCGACRGGVRFIDDISRGGGTLSGGSVKITSLAGREVRAGSQVSFQVLVSFETSKQVVDMPGTKQDKTYPGGTSTAQFLVQPKSSGLVIGYWNEAPA